PTSRASSSRSRTPCARSRQLSTASTITFRKPRSTWSAASRKRSRRPRSWPRKPEAMALHFELVTPARLVRSEDVHMVVVPGTEGEFGVLEGHAPFMSTIRDGAVKIYRTAGSEFESIDVRGGFAEVSASGLTVLAEHVEG